MAIVSIASTYSDIRAEAVAFFIEKVFSCLVAHNFDHIS